MNATRVAPFRKSASTKPESAAVASEIAHNPGKTPLWNFHFGSIAIHPPSRRPVQAGSGAIPSIAERDSLQEREASHFAETMSSAATVHPRHDVHTPMPNRSMSEAVTRELGPGGMLEPHRRQYFEERLGVPLGGVRIHTGERAAASARSVRAQAYTIGHDVVFAHGRFAPDTSAGARLLGHELAHVAQRGDGTVLYRQPDDENMTARADEQMEDANAEYIPNLGTPEKQDPRKSPEEIGRTDLDEMFQTNSTLHDRVITVATELGLDPGFLAATLIAEVSTPGVWSRKSGTIASELLGIDDWFDPQTARYIKRVIREHPDLGFAYSDVQATGATWDTSTEKAGGKAKPRGELDAAKAIAAVGVYLAAGQVMLQRIIDNNAAKRKGGALPGLDTLTPEQRFTVMRVAFNAGVTPANRLYEDLAAGGDIPRTGSTQRNPKNARRTAVLHVARAIHLGQAVFGRHSDEYRPRR